MKPCLKKKVRLTLNLFPCHLCNRVVPHCPEGPSPCLYMAPVNILPHRVHETKHKNPSSQVGEKHKYLRALPIMSKRRSHILPSRQQHVPAQWLGWKLFLGKMISSSLLKALGVDGLINHLFTLTQEQPLCKTNQKAPGSLRTDWRSQRGHLVQTVRTAKQHISISANNLTVCLDSFF